MIVLDVACGAGHAAEQAAPHVRQVVGSRHHACTAARAGRSVFARPDSTTCCSRRATRTALPFLDASFDLVVCRSSLHHFPDPRTAVAEMARVCRPGGRVVVSDMIAPSAEVRDAFDELHRRIDPSHVRALIEREVAELLRDVVGPLSYGDTTSITLPIDVIVTDAADRDAAMSMMLDDIGRNTTGFDPVRDGDDVMVSFTATVVHAIPGAERPSTRPATQPVDTSVPRSSRTTARPAIPRASAPAISTSTTVHDIAVTPVLCALTNVSLNALHLGNRCTAATPSAIGNPVIAASNAAWR